MSSEEAADEAVRKARAKLLADLVAKKRTTSPETAQMLCALAIARQIVSIGKPGTLNSPAPGVLREDSHMRVTLDRLNTNHGPKISQQFDLPWNDLTAAEIKEIGTIQDFVLLLFEHLQ